MFSKKMVLVVCGIILIAVNIIILSVTGKNRNSSNSAGRIGISLVAPFQEVATHLLRFLEDIWKQYFFLASVAEENAELKRALSLAIEKNNQCKEISLSNIRLRKLLNFQKKIDNKFLSAEVIGKDPSPWFKSIIIDKGRYDGVEKGLPVVIPEGITGQVIDVSAHYSKVLLIIDQNSAVDVMIQRIRAPGIIKGESKGQCLLKYALRKHDIRVGDVVVSSGLDGVFPKGLRVGYVSGVIRRNAGIFQEVTVNPYIDFEKLEEVLILLNPPKHAFVGKQ